MSKKKLTDEEADEFLSKKVSGVDWGKEGGDQTAFASVDESGNVTPLTPDDIQRMIERLQSMEAKVESLQRSHIVLEETMDSVTANVRAEPDQIRHIHIQEPAAPTFNGEIESNSRGFNYKITVLGAGSPEELKLLAHSAYIALSGKAPLQAPPGF